MAASTDNDYNAVSREISCKIDMYLFGASVAPLTVDKSNYLIDFDLLDEGSSDGTGPFGPVTANELSFTLYNDGGIFSPTNPTSPYYGRMKKGVECHTYLRVGTKDWDKVGVFYISDWYATITGVTADITAHDRLYNVLGSSDLALPVVLNPTYAQFYTQIFNAFGLAADIDSSLDAIMHMSYTNGTNSDLLTQLSTGAMAVCYCNHNGTITAKSLVTPRSVRAVLSDADQIISVDASFSIRAGYAGATVTYYTTQESIQSEILRIEDFNVPSDTQTAVPMSFSKAPVIRLTYANLVGIADAFVSAMVANSKSITVTTFNPDDTASMNLSIYGTTVESTGTTVGDTDADGALSIDNEYIQSSTVASSMLRVLRRYVSSTLPTLKLTIRGNPLLNIGDKITVTSQKYNLNFTGILLRQHFTYNGALSSELTLLDATLLEVA